MTADPNDLTINGRLDQIADNLETRAGTDPGAARQDWTIPAILQRINDAIQGGAFEAHLIDDHTDASVPSPDDGDFFRYSSTLSVWIADKMVLSDATDVAASPISGHYLRGDGSEWTNSALLLGDFPAIVLDDLDDVVITSGDSGDFLRHNGSNWIDDAIVLGDLPAIALDDLSDVVITSGDSGDFLRHNGANWIDDAIVLGDLPAIALDDLSDTDVSGAANLDLLQFNSGSGNWENETIAAVLDGTYVRRDGTLALLADWGAGSFDITAQGLRATNTVNDVTDTTGIFTYNIKNIAHPGLSTHIGLDVNVDYDYDNPAGIDASTMIGFNLDLSAKTTNVSLSFVKIQGLKCVLTNDAATAFGDLVGENPYYFGITNNKTNQPFTQGAFHVFLNAGTNSMQVVACKFATEFGGTGSGYAYQGYVEAKAGATGEIFIIDAFGFPQVGVTSLIGVQSRPRALGTAPAADLICTFRGESGHTLISNGSLIVTSTLRSLPTNVPTTHLTLTNNEGAGYFEGLVEIDGTLYADGDIDHNGSNIGFFATAPVAQAGAYTQTYATASATHANPTAAVLTDSTGGTANQTLVAISGTSDDAEINNNFADLADEVNKLIADVANAKQVLNQVIDDLQAYGLVQ